MGKAWVMTDQYSCLRSDQVHIWKIYILARHALLACTGQSWQQ